MERRRFLAPSAGNFLLYDSSSDSDNENNNEPHSSGNSGRNGYQPNTSTVWVFGYGSLCWNPGFEFSKCVTGYIRGYVRRFWQGNTSHRGTTEKPGRVATLIDDKQGITWGCAYKLTGHSALDYLKQRECTLGGYVTQYTKFYPRIASDDASEICGEAFPSLIYLATERNSQWLGEDTVPAIAQQIVECSGPSGHNVEYLLRLAAFMRDEIDGAVDEHLFELEANVKAILDKRQICLHSVMGVNPQRIRRDSYEVVRRPPSFEYASRVPDVKLRCLNI